MGSWRYKEPSTVEECDSTWGSDSESDEQPGDNDSGISDSVSPTDTGKCADPTDISPQVNGTAYTNSIKSCVIVVEI